MLWKESSPKGKHSIVAGNPGTSWIVKDVVLDGINSIQGKSCRFHWKKSDMVSSKSINMKHGNYQPNIQKNR